VNLTLAELAELPLAAAAFDGDDIVARTPEWRDAAPGTVCYRVHRARLVVSTENPHPACAPVLTRLLDEIAGIVLALGHRQALRVGMLAASLRMVAGRAAGTSGTSLDVLEHACAGIASRTALSVAIERDDCFPVLDPAVAALALVQFAANAERHDHASAVSLRASEHTLSVTWDGSPGSPGARTARRRAERERWGLGFARIAADSIGGAVYPPVDDDGRRTASLEVGLNRLALPLALVAEGTVVKATRAWDEETRLLPGAEIPASSRATLCAAAARAGGGAIARSEGWCARSAAGGTWIAIPPDSATDRARDVLDGMVHERALWDGVPEPGRSRIVALAAILASMLGADLVRVPGATWNRRAPEMARAYGLRMPLPRFLGAGAVDPRVALFLAGEFGDALEADGDDLYLRIAPAHRHDDLVRAFLSEGDDSLKLS
jgi:hypothetical protein